MPEAALLVLTDLLVGLQKLRHPLPESGHGEGAAAKWFDSEACNAQKDGNTIF